MDHCPLVYAMLIIPTNYDGRSGKEIEVVKTLLKVKINDNDKDYDNDSDNCITGRCK